MDFALIPIALLFFAFGAYVSSVVFMYLLRRPIAKAFKSYHNDLELLKAQIGKYDAFVCSDCGTVTTEKDYDSAAQYKQLKEARKCEVCLRISHDRSK